jgi:cytochrome c2
MTKTLISGIALALCLSTSAFAAGEEGENVTINPPASVTLEEGLAAWDRVYEVASHPRCANCHTGESDRPMWSGPAYGKTRVHGMNIRAGESRIGAEFLLCSTCHAYNDGANDAPHMAPQVAMNWQLAPVEADWFGKTSDEICTQLRDPELNGDRDYLDLASHLDHDLILHWAWNPGGGREPAPYSLQEHVDDILAWGVAGYPCHSDN